MRTRMRAAWLQVHLWLGLTLGTLGVFIGLSGSMLVFDTKIDALLNPHRYAVSGSQVALPYSEYEKRAHAVLKGDARLTLMRFPHDERMPVVVFAGGSADRSGLMRVYLDPPTGRVLDVARGGGLMGWLHRFHENLTLRDYRGREIVGLVGLAMLISSLSGLYLWWPLRGRLRDALGFRKGFSLTRNLHYVIGFYSALMLATLSFTGVFIAWPDAGRSVVGTFAPLSAAPRFDASASADRGRRIGLDEAVDAARALYPDAAVSSVALPSGSRSIYRVSLRDARERTMLSPGPVAFIDSRSGAVLHRSDASTRTAADGFLGAQRTLHSGQPLGVIGRILFCGAGLMPAVLVITGTLMWLRQRRSKRGPAL